jgi:hypothetical protein
MTEVALATEDELSETVGRRLLVDARPQLGAGLLLRKGGFGYLRSGMAKWCALARAQPVFLLADLDHEPCASSLIRNWLRELPRPEDLLLRVAVREIEAWLLADHEGMQRLLGRKGTPSVDPDLLQDPKQHLLQLARSAKRDVRRDLVAERGTVAAQGIAYNARLCDFVSNDWDPERASSRSASLRRARLRIDELAVRLRNR